MKTARKRIDTYVVYKGDEVIAVGTAVECANILEIKVSTVKFYATKSYKQRVEASVKPDECLIAERVKDD